MKQVAGNQQLVIADEEITDIDHVNYVWRRQNGEPATAYGYFKLYLNQPTPRKLDKTAKQARVTRSALSVYCAKYKWVERAAAYDDNESTKELERKRRWREAKDLEWSARRDKQREDEWNIAQQFMAKVRQMLSVPLFREEITEYLDGLDEQGRIIIKQVIINEPLDWSPSDMAKFFEVAAKMARLATGMDTDRKRIKIDVSALSDEELDELIDEG
jgi:hypothetical protein